MKNLASSTGFTIVQPSEPGFMLEGTTYRQSTLTAAEEKPSSLVFGGNNKDDRIKKLVKKASYAYIVDALVRQTVDRYSEFFREFDFEGGKPQVAYIKERLISMTLQSGEHWETLIARAINEYFKTGNCFIIKLRGATTPVPRRCLYKQRPYSLSGLFLIAPDRVEAVQNNSRFEGWELTTTSNSKEKLKLITPIENAKIDPSTALISITKMPEDEHTLVPGMDVFHLAYKKPAHSNWGFGLTLAALEDVNLLRIIEQTTSIMIKKFSTPIIHHKIIRPSSPLAGIQQEINHAYGIYKNMSPDGLIITGGNTEIKAVGSESAALRVEGYLNYFLGRTLAGLGSNKYMIGVDSGSMGTVESTIQLMMMKIRYCQKEIAREFEMFLFNELLWEGGFDPYKNEKDKVSLIFKEIDPERLIKLQNHAADLFNKNYLGWDEARQLGEITTTTAPAQLVVNKVDIAKLKADAEAKGKSAVLVAKAQPKPVASKPVRSAKNTKEDLKYLVPQTEEQIPRFLDILQSKYELEPTAEMLNNVSKLLNDEEAILEYVVQCLCE